MTFDLQRYIPRRVDALLAKSLAQVPITVLLGPRQCGKTTSAKQALAAHPDALFLDLERPSDQRKLEDPEFFLHSQQHL